MNREEALRALVEDLRQEARDLVSLGAKLSNETTSGLNTAALATATAAYEAVPADPCREVTP